MSWAAVAIGGGALLGFGGSYLSGQADENAAASQRDQLDRLLNQQYQYQSRARGGMAGELLGGGAQDWLKANMSPQEWGGFFGTPDQHVQETVTNPLPGTNFNSGGVGGRNSGRGRAIGSMPMTPGSPGSSSYTFDKTIPGQPGMFDEAAYNRQYANKPGALDQLAGIAANYKQQGKDTMAGYDADTARLTRLFANDTSRLLGQSSDIEQGARTFGEGERARINRDAGQALTGLNRATTAQLRGSGLNNSSVAGDRQAMNTRSMFAGQQDALGRLGDSQINLMSGLKKNTLDLGGTRAMGGFGFQADRSSQRTPLELALQERGYGLDRMPIDTRLSFMSSPLMNPGVNMNTSQFQSQTSGGIGGAMGGFFGNTGGAAMNMGLMELMRRQSGGNGQPNNAGSFFDPNMRYA